MLSAAKPFIVMFVRTVNLQHFSAILAQGECARDYYKTPVMTMNSEFDTSAASNHPSFYAIVPARYASSRFPGKPLTPILGQPMFLRVVRRVLECDLFSGVCLATDDQRIADSARQHGVCTVLTGTEHSSGTERAGEAAEKLGLSSHSVVVNVQGDEPALIPDMLRELLTPFFRDDSVLVTTWARSIGDEEAGDPNLVKVVCDQGGQALYFSRSLIPCPRNPEHAAYLGHIGLYAMRYSVLRKFSLLSPGTLEQAENLEQLRLLENGIPIRVKRTRHSIRGVDTPEDVEDVERIIQEQQKCGLF